MSSFGRISSLEPKSGAIYDGDLQDREKDCKQLKDEILNTKTPYVLAVNSTWGAGKTTFLKMLKRECEDADMRCIYFDAWEADFHHDALTAMIGEINEKFKQSKEFSDSSLLDKMNNVLEVMNKNIEIIEVIKLLASCMGKGESAEELKKILISPRERVLDEYTMRKKAVVDFQTALKEFANENNNDKPIVFFIDELDRCRPVFAVEVLEKIKHIFDVPRIFFVIAVNKKELEKVLRSVYGQINSEIYLRRFFDNEFRLENSNTIFIQAFRHCSDSSTESRDVMDALRVASLLCFDDRLSLRDQQQIATILAKAVADIKNVNPKWPMSIEIFIVLATFFIVMKFVKRSFYDECYEHAKNDVLPLLTNKINYFKNKTQGHNKHPHLESYVYNPYLNKWLENISSRMLDVDKAQCAKRDRQLFQSIELGARDIKR